MSSSTAIVSKKFKHVSELMNPILDVDLSTLTDELLRCVTEKCARTSKLNSFVPAQHVVQTKDAAVDYYLFRNHSKPKFRVSFFHLDDGKKKNKKKDQEDGKKDEKPSPKVKSQSNHSKFHRRRSVAYVWVDTTEPGGVKKGVVFYGGCVYNPNVTMKDVVSQVSMSNPKTLDDLAKVFSVLKKKQSQTKPFVRSEEVRTAVDRLRIRPVVFETFATTEEQVRHEIERKVFEYGVFARRPSSTKKVVDDGRTVPEEPSELN